MNKKLLKIDCMNISLNQQNIEVYSTYSDIEDFIYAYRTVDEIISDNGEPIYMRRLIANFDPWDMMNTVLYNDVDEWMNRKCKKFIEEEIPVMIWFKVRTNRENVSDIINRIIKKFNNVVQLILSIHNSVTTKVAIHELPKTLRSFVLEDTFRKETVYPEIPDALESLILCHDSYMITNNNRNFCYKGDSLKNVIWSIKFPKYKPEIMKILKTYISNDVAIFLLQYFEELKESKN